MTEDQFRAAIVTEARSWIGTPYRGVGCIKGAGVNCAMLLWGVAKGAGVIPTDTKAPQWYTPQLATHSKQERLIGYLVSYGAASVDSPKTGDLVVYQSGQSHGHAGIVISWPNEIVHALPPQGVQMGRGDEGRLHAMKPAFYTLWKS